MVIGGVGFGEEGVVDGFLHGGVKESAVWGEGEEVRVELLEVLRCEERERHFAIDKWSDSHVVKIKSDILL